MRKVINNSDYQTGTGSLIPTEMNIVSQLIEALETGMSSDKVMGIIDLSDYLKNEGLVVRTPQSSGGNIS